MWDIPGGVSLIAAVLGVAAVLGGAALVAKDANYRGRIIRLRDDIVDADRRATRLAAELAEARAERDLTRVELDETRKEYDLLQRVTSGQVGVAALEQQLAHHHDEMARALTDARDRVMQELGALRAEMEDVRDDLGPRRRTEGGRRV